jgi:hypothetical protein
MPVLKDIERFKEILGSEQLVLNLIKEELIALKSSSATSAERKS